jgi:hypothetical protein
MSQQPEHLLQRAAARPRKGPDVAALSARAGRRRTVRRAGTAVSVVAVLGLVGAGALTLGGPGGGEVVLQQPSGSAASPSPELTPPSPELTSPSPGPTSEASETPSSSDTEAQDSEEGFNAATKNYERPPGPGQEIAVLSEVRTGTHEVYDRVVWEFSQGARPHLWVEYVDQPAQPGSGHPVEVAGEAYLRLIAGGARDISAEHMTRSDVAPYEGPERLDAPNAPAIQEVVALGDFEAHMQWAVGLDSQRPFRVQVLRDPLRIVIDIANSDA